MALAVLLTSVLAGCSSSDYGSSTEAAPSPMVTQSALPGVPTTSADGYPNINVDTARPVRGSIRTVEERGRLESELMALGERQRAGVDSGPSPSVVQELQELGRRSKADAERQIESGGAPTQP